MDSVGDRSDGLEAGSHDPGIRPLLMLDVDGVLNPFVGRRSVVPPGFMEYTLDVYSVLLTPRHGEWLRPLLGTYELVWATTWEHDANRLIAPLVGLPGDAPVVTFGDVVRRGDWKLQAIDEFAGDRPVAWIDDDLGRDAYAWAVSRPSPTLLLRSDPGIGLARRHITALERFAERLAPSVSE